MSSKYAFTKSVRELRFLFCQTSEQSAPVRSFLARAYPTMKKNNPNTPILLREAAGTVPRLYARYDLGREQSQPLQGLTDQQIEEALTTLVKDKTA